MIKKCPMCGSDKIKDKLTCPDCGYQIEETDQHTNEENESITQPQENSSEEVFPDSELNDPIEWSELKDLPLESVMEIFKNDGNTEENNQSQTVGNTNDKENEKDPIDSAKDLNKKDSTKEQDLEKAINAEQKKRVAELKEFVDQEEENSILAAYIKAHREDTTEEHAKELLKMIDEKITSKENPSFNQEQADKTDSSISKTDKQEPIEPVSPTEEKVTSPTADSAKKQDENIIEEEKVEETQLSSIKSDQTTSDQERETASFLKETAKTDTEESKQSNEQLAPTAATIENEKRNEEPTSSSTEEHEASETVDQPKKSKKIPYMVLVAVLLLSAGGWAYYDHQQNVQAQIAAEEAKQQKKVNELKKTLAAFYVDDAHQFLRTAMINQDLSKLRTSLDGVKEEKGYADLEKTYEDIQTKVKSIKGVNELFTAEAIIDDHLADDLKLKTDQEIKRVETDESDFGQLLKKAQDEAVAQYDQLQSAKEKTKVVYADNKVSESATREQYTDAKKAVEQVKNQDLVTTLKDQLNQVDKGLTEKEKKEEQQKKEEEEKQAAAKQAAAKQAAEAAEAARKAQAAAQAQASQQASASTSSTNKNTANQPIMSTRQSDIADTANAAWNWAPGIQEKVINTCIQRGYIVQGGYRLERVRIENGEGYYNLYATSTKSALMNGIDESALPFYIVTINCKTGWFGGNGSR